VGRRTQGHRNLRAVIARQKAKTRFYRELWHTACATAERSSVPPLLHPLVEERPGRGGLRPVSHEPTMTATNALPSSDNKPLSKL
jgi:hypothetical protein